MKIFLGILILVLILIDTGVYFSLRKYLKIHENEVLEAHLKHIVTRITLIIIIIILISVIGILMYFV